MAFGRGYCQTDTDELRQRILKYKVGDFGFPCSFPDASDGEMEGMQLNVVLFGIAGAGKSALINTIFKIFKGTRPAAEQSAGNEGTVLLEDFRLTPHITLYDTRGFMDFNNIEETELFRIAYGLARPGEELDRSSAGDRKAITAGRAAHRLEKPPIVDQMHVVLWVIKAIDVRFVKGKYRDSINFIRDRFSAYEFTIITVITFDDQISRTGNSGEEMKEVVKAREVTGSRKEDVFILANWKSSQTQYNAKYQAEVLKMLERALRCGELRIRGQQTKRKLSMMEISSATSARQMGPVENTEPPGDYKKEK